MNGAIWVGVIAGALYELAEQGFVPTYQKMETATPAWPAAKLVIALGLMLLGADEDPNQSVVIAGCLVTLGSFTLTRMALRAGLVWRGRIKRS